VATSPFLISVVVMLLGAELDAAIESKSAGRSVTAPTAASGWSGLRRRS
jgi:hypothetical protein